MMHRAEDHYFQKRYNVALRLFQLVIKKDPENPLAYRYAGDIFLIKNQLQEAKEHFSTARELSPQPQEEWLRLAQAHILANEGPQAIQALQTALKIKPDMHLCRFYLGLTYFKLFRDKLNTIKQWEIYEKHIFGEEKRKIQRALAILRKKNYSFPNENSESDSDLDHFEPTY